MGWTLSQAAEPGPGLGLVDQLGNSCRAGLGAFVLALCKSPTLKPPQIYIGYKLKHSPCRASQVALVVKNLPANAGDVERCEFDSWVGKIP